MDQTSTLLTGDAVLFCGNTPTGFILRTMVSTDWNHSGVAVRIIFNSDGTKSISLTEKGDLYILETNTGSRYDDVHGEFLKGAGFSRSSWVFPRYNKIAVRRLHPRFRTPSLASLTLSFSTKYKGIPFPSSSIPFFSIWLGISSKDTTDLSSPSMFCSELMTHYYTYVIGNQYKSITGSPFDGNLSTLFGTKAPLSEDMFTPDHFSSLSTPNASIFLPSHEIIYTVNADILFVILQPLILILGLMLFIWMTLPHSP